MRARTYTVASAAGTAADGEGAADHGADESTAGASAGITAAARKDWQQR